MTLIKDYFCDLLQDQTTSRRVVPSHLQAETCHIKTTPQTVSGVFVHKRGDFMTKTTTVTEGSAL